MIPNCSFQKSEGPKHFCSFSDSNITLTVTKVRIPLKCEGHKPAGSHRPAKTRGNTEGTKISLAPFLPPLHMNTVQGGEIFHQDTPKPSRKQVAGERYQQLYQQFYHGQHLITMCPCLSRAGAAGFGGTVNNRRYLCHLCRSTV